MLDRKTMREGREPLIKDKKELLEELRAFMKYQQRERLRQEQTDVALRGGGDPDTSSHVDDMKSDTSPGAVCLEAGLA